MARKKQKKSNKKTTQAKPSPQQLKAIERLKDKGDLDQAISRLEVLLKQYPKFSVLYLLSIEIYERWDNLPKATWMALRWTQISPNSMKAWQYLLDLSFNSGFSALTYKAVRTYNKLATKANLELHERPSAEELEVFIMSGAKGSPIPDSMDDAIIFDVGRVLLSAEQWKECLFYLEDSLDYPPVANNYALALFQLGDIEKAMLVYQNAFAQEPSNLFAMTAYLRLLVWNGQMDEAQNIADKLQEQTPSRALYADAQLAGLAFLGRYKDAFTCYQRLDKESIDEMEPAFYHLEASIAFMVDKKDLARELWNRSPEKLYRGVEENPFTLLATTPEKSRHPAIFADSELIPRGWLRILGSLAERFTKEQAMYKALREEIVPLPSLDYLRLCYESGSDSVLFLIEMLLASHAIAGNTEAKQLLIDFLSSTRTTVEAKMLLLQRAQIAEVISSEEKNINYWNGTENIAITPMNFSITREAGQTSLAKKDFKVMEKAVALLRKQETTKARELLQTLVTRYPKEKSVRGNIAASWSVEDPEKSMQEYKQIIQDIPDYLFARAMLAEKYISKGEIDEAEKLLQPDLLQRDEYHIEEFIIVMGVQAYYHAAKGNEEATNKFLELLPKVVEYPDEKKKVKVWENKVERMLHPEKHFDLTDLLSKDVLQRLKKEIK